MDKETKKLLRTLQAAGHRVKHLKSGHIMVYHANGHDIVTISGTPSDRRAWANAKAQLRRQGFL